MLLFRKREEKKSFQRIRIPVIQTYATKEREHGEKKKGDRQRE